MSDTFTLPNGEAFTLRVDITSKESAGIKVHHSLLLIYQYVSSRAQDGHIFKVLIAASSLSLVSVAGLLITISVRTPHHP